MRYYAYFKNSRNSTEISQFRESKPAFRKIFTPALDLYFLNGYDGNDDGDWHKNKGTQILDGLELFFQNFLW